MAGKYKLFDLIATFDAKETRKVRKMLRSPFFVYQKNALELFEEVVKYYEKKQQEPTLEYLFKKIFPYEKFDSLKLRGLMSHLLTTLEEWMLINHFRNDPIESRLILSSIYRKRKLEKNFQSSIKKSSHLLETFPHRNEYYYEQSLKFYEENMNHEMSSKRTDNLYFQEISENTDISFLIRKLKNACSLLTHQSVVKTEYDFGLLDNFINDLEQNSYLETPAVALYYYCFRFLKEENNLHYFQKFKTTLTDHRSKFSIEDLKGPFLLGVNFCIKKLNQGDKPFAKEGLELYKEGLKQGILLENNKINRFTFSNIVAMALVLEEFDWLEKFIDESSEKLRPNYREATICFNKARLSFARKEFGDALLHLQSAEYKDLVNIIISKSLLIQIYYELGEIRSLESHLDSFAQFIRRREVSDYHRKNFVNIIGFVRKIMGTPVYENEQRNELKKAIEKERVLSVSVKAWLLEKVGG